MPNLIILFITIIVLTAIITQYLNFRRVEIDHADISKEGYFPYVKKQYLMSISERHFYMQLVDIVGDKFHIVPQVLLSKIVEVKEGDPTPKGDRSRIDKKSVDFVLFGKPYFNPVLVIELDDRTHNWHYRRVRDEFVDEVLKQVQIPIIHVKNTRVYDFESIKQFINNYQS